MAARCGGWADLSDGKLEDCEAVEIEFLNLWGKVRFRADEDPVDQAIAKATAHRLCPTRCKEGRLPKYAFFVSVAGWLQVTMGDRNIELPCKLLAEKLKTTRDSISGWRKLAETEGYLQIVKAHEWHPKGSSKATEFRFDISRWDILLAICPWAKKVRR